MEANKQSSNGMMLNEYINAFKTLGKAANPNIYAPKMTSDEYKIFKRMPDGEFRNYIEKLASGSPQGDSKAKDTLKDIGFYEANPRSAERFSQTLTEPIMETEKRPNPESARLLARQLEIARKTGYVQGICECVAAIGGDHALGKKLLSKMNITRNMAKKFATPETYKALEQGIFAPQQKLEQAQSIKR